MIILINLQQITATVYSLTWLYEVRNKPCNLKAYHILNSSKRNYCQNCGKSALVGQQNRGSHGQSVDVILWLRNLGFKFLPILSQFLHPN